MLKPGLEKFDSPIVMVSQQFAGQEWGVTTSYCSLQDVQESEGELNAEDIGWGVRVTMPDYEDLYLDGTFPSPEAAIEYAIERILSGTLTASITDENPAELNPHPFGQYHSIA
jgi:hypothetical protein